MAYGDGGTSPSYGDNRAGVGGYVSVTAETYTKPETYDTLDSIVLSDEAESMYLIGNPIVLLNRIYNPVSQNYIRPTNIFRLTSSWEICLKMMITEYYVDPSQGVGVCAMYTSDGTDRNVNIFLDANYKIACQLSSNGTSFNLGTLTTSTPVPLNTEFYVKIVRESNYYKMYYGTDLNNMTLTDTITSSTDVTSATHPIVFGADYMGNSAWTNSSTGKYNYWNGYIDVSGSYLKIDGVKVFGNKPIVVGTFFPKSWINIYSDGWCEQSLVNYQYEGSDKYFTLFEEINTSKIYSLTYGGRISNVTFDGSTVTYHHGGGYGTITVKGYINRT